jgi:hypothetical protein
MWARLHAQASRLRRMQAMDSVLGRAEDTVQEKAHVEPDSRTTPLSFYPLDLHDFFFSCKFAIQREALFCTHLKMQHGLSSAHFDEFFAVTKQIVAFPSMDFLPSSSPDTSGFVFVLSDRRYDRISTTRSVA